MTEQELDQHRDHVLELDIEQLRCGVMLQLHKIDELTARVAMLDEAVAQLEDERDVLKNAERLALDALEPGVSIYFERRDAAVKALKAVL